MTSVAPATWLVRAATAADEAQIRALVHSEKLKPTGIRWRNFVVASDGDEIIGTAQVRLHLDGSRELASVVVTPRHRGRGVAAALIRRLLSRQSGRLYVVSSCHLASLYARFGFRSQSAWAIPPAVQLSLLMGRLAGLRSRLRGQQATRLEALARFGPIQVAVTRSRRSRTAIRSSELTHPYIFSEILS